jgi:hypothetical protein
MHTGVCSENLKERSPLNDLGVDNSIVLNDSWSNVMEGWRPALNSCDLGCEQVAALCAHSNEISGFKSFTELLD